jgi:hypothetical protein
VTPLVKVTTGKVHVHRVAGVTREIQKTFWEKYLREDFSSGKISQRDIILERILKLL